jgi:predicted transposase YdaD
MIKTRDKSSSKVAHPHDRLVKRLLSIPDVAKDILTLYLPKNVQTLMDLNNLILQRDSFIDDEHRAYYLLNEGKFLSKDRFWSILHQEFSPEIEDKVMTIAEQLKAEGEIKGIEKTKIEVAKRLLIEGIKLDVIAKVTKLPLTKIKELQTKSKH